MAGAVSGVIASFVATPPDVVKTRILSKQPNPATAIMSGMTIEQDAANLQTEAAVFPMSNSTLGVSPFQPLAGLTSSSKLASASSLTPSFVSTSVSNSRAQGSNAWEVFCTILEEEGYEVLFRGVTERCLGAVPRFGTTMAMHDVLEKVVFQAGWLHHSI